jgi:pimeloyl-ACP methyl ester carboxylesterase
MEQKPEVKSVECQDVDIQYLQYGEGRENLVFLHATGFLPWLWHPIAREFADRYTVLSPYFCDHRYADHEKGLNWALLAEDLNCMLKNLGIEKPFMIGHSMGATVITLAEAFFGPLAEKMVVIEPIFLPEAAYGMEITVDQHPLASKSIKRRNHWQNTAEARDYLRSKELFKHWDDEMLELYVTHGMVSCDGNGLKLACSPRREAALFMGSMYENPWPLLEKVTCPVLVVEGGTSTNRQFIDLKKAAETFPRGRYLEVSDAGHLVPMERPVETSRLVRRFIEN